MSGVFIRGPGEGTDTVTPRKKACDKGGDLNTPQPVTVTLQKFAEKVAELKKLLGK